MDKIELKRKKAEYCNFKQLVLKEIDESKLHHTQKRKLKNQVDMVDESVCNILKECEDSGLSCDIESAIDSVCLGKEYLMDIKESIKTKRFLTYSQLGY